MAFGKTPEQKAEEAAATARADARRAADEARAEAARVEEEFRASPLGQAVAAKEQGQGFFEVQLTVGSSQRDSTIWGDNNSARAQTETRSHAGTLAAIEAAGWRLEHVGYIFVITGENSRDKFLGMGNRQR